MSLPFLVNADAATIVAIRQDEEAFADWRAELRTVVRSISALPSAGATFEQEAQEVLSDALLPKARALRSEVSRSSVMKSAAGSAALTLGIGAASLAGADLITGSPLDVAGLTALGISSTASWLLASVFGEDPGRPRGVLATLVADWDQRGGPV